MTFSDLKNIPGLQFMPVRVDKKPIHENWQHEKRDYDLQNAKAVGIVCGKLSANENGAGLEAIDADMKYDLTGDLFKRFKVMISESNPDLLKKLVVQKTKNNGYHLLYRCMKVDGNLKLARRLATEEEKNKGDKIKVLFETRGEGGYVMCYPSDGYDLIYGDFNSIQEITEEEREIIFSAARSFNEVFDEYRSDHAVAAKKNFRGLTPLDDYNERGDVVALLQSHGWTVTGSKSSKTFLLRPGQTSSKTSGNYDHAKGWFTVFTTSSEFNPETAYLPYHVFAILECGGDFSEAKKKLYDMGYGDREEAIQKFNKKPLSKISLSDEDYSFLANSSDYDQYLKDVRSGTLQQGLTTGITCLDEHFLFKHGNLVIINGHDNVGKSVVIWYLALLSAMLHGWKWLIFASENTLGNFMQRMIEFFWSKSIKNQSNQEYNAAKKFIEEHFKLIKAEDEFYSHHDILQIAKKTLKIFQYNDILIDPYNSLKIDMPFTSKLSTHEYHYEALSEMKIFLKKEKKGMYINCHAVTGALRQRDGSGFSVAPQKADTEGGGKFSNKADDFLTIHRNVQSVDERNVNEIHVRKIKVTETGGMTTPLKSPVKIKMIPGGIGFIENYLGSERNPVQEIHFAWKKKNHIFDKDIF